MISSIVNLFFPKVCYACLNVLHDNEDSICTTCRHNLPVTNFHFNADDTVKKVLYGRAEIEHATALFRFEKKGLVQQLIHGLKYKGYEKIGGCLGDWIGAELTTIEAYKTIDMVIPVPLHKNRLKQRGYNQVARFGQHIAKALNIKYLDDALIKVGRTKSQVHKKRFARWNDDQSFFTLHHKSTIEGKHILLVDDLITTGATMEACITALRSAKDLKISIVTMAIA